MTSLSRVEKVRLSKRAKRIKLTRTGIASTLALGLAGCVQSSAATTYETPEQDKGLLTSENLSKKTLAEGQADRKKVDPHYLYSFYENDDLNKEVKVYGFKNTFDLDVIKVEADRDHKIEYNEYIDTDIRPLSSAIEVYEEVEGSEGLNEEDSIITEELTKVIPQTEGLTEERNQDQETFESDQESIASEADKKESAGHEQQVNETKEPHVENDLINTENTQNQETTQTNERENNDVDQEEPERTIERNNHGKVLAVEENRFSIETEDGPKWFVAKSEDTIKEIKPNMAVSVYFNEQGDENKVSRFFITFTPDEGDQTEFIEAHFLHYAGEPKRAIVVYIPHQQVIFDLTESLQSRDLSTEYANGQAITLGTVTRPDGSIVVESITPSLKEEQLSNI
ncbi:hypothetical protein [Bacillus sp. JCM 19041]|uniref:hypothetical protein n=1 Tax=Bacillus sp. JCM 19041 TaxID=1460637 RepID=UPI0006D0E62C